MSGSHEHDGYPGRSLLQRTLRLITAALLGFGCLSIGTAAARAQSSDASVTMQISARMLPSQGAQVTNASESGPAGAGGGSTTPASVGNATGAFGGDSSLAMPGPAAGWEVPTWDVTSVEPDARSQYVIEVAQHAPVTAVFDVTGQFADSDRSMARVFSRATDGRQLTSEMIARLVNGMSVQLSGGQYFFDMGGDFDVADQDTAGQDVEDGSVGVYEGIFTLTLIYN